MPPSIYLDDGTVLLEEPASRVVLTFYKSGFDNDRGEVSIHRSIKGLSEVITGTDHLRHGFPWSGMVTVEGYGQWLLRELGIGNRINMLVRSILPYAMKQLVAHLYLLNRVEDPLPRRREYMPQYLLANEAAGENSPYPWPKDHVVSSTLTRMLSSNEAIYLPDNVNDAQFMDLPLLKQCMNDLSAKCPCVGCTGSDKLPGSLFINEHKCDKEKVLEKIAILALHVLILSLFDFPGDLLIYTYRDHGRSKLVEAVSLILRARTPVTCSINNILKVALNLLGHSVGDMSSDNVEVNGSPPDDLSGDNHWVISCFRGQAVYPMMFETQTPFEDGYMTLCWAAGLLRYEGENYSQGKGINNTLYISRMISYDAVTTASNLLPGHNLEWRVTSGDTVLDIVLGIQRSGDPVFEHGVRSPIQILIGLTSTLILHSCAHDPHAELAEPDPCCARSIGRYGTKITHYIDGVAFHIDPRTIEIVPVDGNDSLRMYALASYAYYSPIILRRNACLACCIVAARRIGAKVIIC